MLFDIVRFNQFALDLLISEDSEGWGDGSGYSMISHVHDEETIGEYLENEGYSDAFRDDYLIPLIAALWSTSPGKSLLDFPAAQLVRFL
jgi:predicted NAD/FAD-binding protein